jgi:hypothetical protein
MNTSKRWLPLVVGVSLVVLLLIGLTLVGPAFAQGPGGMRWGGFGSGMMGGYGYGPGYMMGSAQPYTGTLPYGPGMMGGQMMGGYGRGGMMGGGMMGGGMMGGGMMFNRSALVAPEPLTLAEATQAVEAYLATLNDDNLILEEVMIFDNHAYAEIVEKETGIGAMEVLVDPVTKAVYPEMGPNMMWNAKYGMMAGSGGYGMMGGMMGGFGYNRMMGNLTPGGDVPAPPEVSAEMPVSPAEAVEIAQAYLDAYLPGNLEADEHADPFYGYYTLHLNRDGATVGMLSVNGYTRQVFVHGWHGDFITMSGE